MTKASKKRSQVAGPTLRETAFGPLFNQLQAMNEAETAEDALAAIEPHALVRSLRQGRLHVLANFAFLSTTSAKAMSVWVNHCAEQLAPFEELWIELDRDEGGFLLSIVGEIAHAPDAEDNFIAVISGNPIAAVLGAIKVTLRGARGAARHNAQVASNTRRYLSALEAWCDHAVEVFQEVVMPFAVSDLEAAQGIKRR